MHRPHKHALGCLLLLLSAGCALRATGRADVQADEAFRRSLLLVLVGLDKNAAADPRAIRPGVTDGFGESDLADPATYRIDERRESIRLAGLPEADHQLADYCIANVPSIMLEPIPPERYEALERARKRCGDVDFSQFVLIASLPKVDSETGWSTVRVFGVGDDAFYGWVVTFDRGLRVVSFELFVAFQME